MAYPPLKSLVSFMQKRFVQSKASKLVKPTLKPSAVREVESKTKKANAILSVGEKEESVVDYLKSQQFSETQIAKLIEKYPRILKSRVATTLEPKLKYLNSNGFKGKILPEIIVMNPLILRKSLTAHLIPSLEFLKAQIGEKNEGILLKVIKRASWLLTLDLEKVLQPNIHLLVKEGVPMANILKLFYSQPRSLLCSADKMLYGVETVKEFGIKPYEPMFIHALRMAVSMKEAHLKKKMEAFKSLGWSDEDIVSTMVRQPLCLTCSEDKLKSNMEFLVKTMKFEPKVVIGYPKLIMYSLHKRIIPRCNVFMLLREKKLLNDRLVPSLLNIPEKDFIRRYINKYMNSVPYLLDVYHSNLKMDDVAARH